MFTAKCRGGQHFVGGVNVHVVLLRMHAEILDTLRDGVVLLHDLYLVIDDSTGVRDPLPSYHKLIVRVAPESLSPSPVTAGQASPIPYIMEHALFPLSSVRAP